MIVDTLKRFLAVVGAEDGVVSSRESSSIEAWRKDEARINIIITDKQKQLNNQVYLSY